MGYIVGVLLMLAGTVLGLVGDYPLDSLAYRSLGMMVAGGVLVAAGLSVLLLKAGQRGSRDDEPSCQIRP